MWGENVLSFKMQVGEGEKEQCHCMGAYSPPSDKEGKAQRLMTAAIWAQPEGARLIVLGDLNTNLDSPRGRQEDVLAAEATEQGLVCASRHFLSRRMRHVRRRGTFRRPNYTPEGERRWIRGKPDYALVTARDRRRVRSCRWLLVRHHDSDHRALVLRVETDEKGVQRYDKARRTLPAPPPPHTHQAR